jgi:hypothetical protein
MKTLIKLSEYLRLGGKLNKLLAGKVYINANILNGKDKMVLSVEDNGEKNSNNDSLYTVNFTDATVVKHRISDICVEVDFVLSEKYTS